MTISPNEPSPRSSPPAPGAQQSRARLPQNLVLPAAVALLLAAVILHRLLGDRLPALGPAGGSYATTFTNFALYFLTRPAAAVLAATLLLQHKRLVPLAIATLAAAGIALMFNLVLLFVEDLSGLTRRPELLLDVYRGADHLCLAMALGSLIHFPVLRGRAYLVQLAASVSAGVFLLLQIAARMLSHLPPGEASMAVVQLTAMASVVLGLVAFTCVPLTAYLGFRRRIPFAHQAPVDAQPIVALTCPRCSSAQRIPANGGQCAQCRLEIFIALAEGRCKSCRYALRGLTGDKCPECGTPFGAAGNVR